MLDMALSELGTEEQREEAMFKLAQRVIKRGITEDARVMERAKRTILELTDGNREIEIIPDLLEERSKSSQAEGNGNAQAP